MKLPDTQKMINHASQLRRITEDINRLNNVDIRTASDSIAAVWSGESANAFLRHCRATHEHISNTADELLECANDLEDFARDLESQTNNLKLRE